LAPLGATPSLSGERGAVVLDPAAVDVDVGRLETQTQEHFGTAATLFREMDMRYRLEQADAALPELD
jgi:hypothetical protein